MKKEKNVFLWYFARFALSLAYGRRYSRSRKLKKVLVFFSLIRIFVAGLWNR